MKPGTDTEVLFDRGRIFLLPVIKKIGKNRGFWVSFCQAKQIRQYGLRNHRGLQKHVSAVLLVQAAASEKKREQNNGTNFYIQNSAKVKAHAKT